MVDCKDIAETLLDCLRQTECMKGGKGAKECMKLTDECRVYRNTYFECKRSQLDMRMRRRDDAGESKKRHGLRGLWADREATRRV